LLAAADAKQLHQCLPVNQTVALGCVLNLSVAAMRPLGGVLDDSGTDPIQVRLHDTLNQVFICLHCRSMIAIFPEGGFSVLPPVVLLSNTTRRQLNALRDNLSAIAVINEQMDVVGSRHVIEDNQPIPLLSLKEPVEPALPILGKLQEEFLLVTAKGDVPHMTRYVVNLWAESPLCMNPAIVFCTFAQVLAEDKDSQYSQSCSVWLWIRFQSLAGCCPKAPGPLHRNPSQSIMR
jgi:hypothetical protein